MCGLIGYSSNTNFDEEKIKLLMIWSSLERGMDSTGIYTPGKDIFKSLESGRTLFFSKQANYKLESSTLLIGHVRAATVGHKILNNAHPFKRGNYILAHNGTLTNHLDIAKKYDLGGLNIQVDSEIICAAINKNDNFNVLSEILGAAAFLISDTRTPDILYAYTNGERPLYKGYVDGNLYISSIQEALLHIGAINVKLFKTNVLYTIQNGAVIKTRNIKVNPYRDNLSVLKSLIDFQKQTNVRLRGADNYYRVITIAVSNGRYIYTLKDPEKNFIVTAPSDSINTWDFLEVGNLVYLTIDKERNVYDQGEKKWINKIIPKYTVCEIVNVYNDGDVGLKDYITKESYSYVSREYVIKTSRKSISKLPKPTPINKNNIIQIGTVGAASPKEGISDILDTVELTVSYADLIFCLSEIKKIADSLKEAIDITLKEESTLINNELLKLNYLIDDQKEIYKNLAEADLDILQE